LTGTITPLRAYLTRNPVARTLMQERLHQQQLLREVERLLPKPLDEHCLAAVREQGRLVLFVDGPVWASRMRFLAPDIARRLRGKPPAPLLEVKIRVVPARRAAPRRDKPTRARLSASTRTLLLESAQSIADPSLRSALKRLARVQSDSGPEPDRSGQ
jgi:hypothetical protein